MEQALDVLILLVLIAASPLIILLGLGVIDLIIRGSDDGFRRRDIDNE